MREEDFTLDPTGNWTDYVQKTSGSTDLDQDRTHNEVNETTDITETTGPAWVTPVHDRAGNMTTAPNPSSLTTALTCTYDAWNRLVEADPTGLLTFKHEYDGLNRRTARKVEAGATEAYQYFYYNASWQRLEMRPDVTTGDPPEELQPYCQHVWSARYIDAPVLWDRDADNDSETGDLGKSGSGLEERLYYLGDANFNVTTLVDTDGEAVEHYQYDPYGRVKVLNGAAPDTDGDEWTDDPNNGTDVANVILYTGREYDSIICLYQYRHRYYHADLGRFLSRDPKGFSAGDANVYRYVHNRPQGAIDPTGETSIIPLVPLPPGRFALQGTNYVIDPVVGRGAPRPYGLIQMAETLVRGFESDWGHPNIHGCTGTWGKVKRSASVKGVTTESGVWGAGPNGTCNTVHRNRNRFYKTDHAGSIALYVHNLGVGEYEVAYWYSASITTNDRASGGGISSVETFDFEPGKIPRARNRVEARVQPGRPAAGTGVAKVVVTPATKNQLIKVATIDVTLRNSGDGTLRGMGRSRWKRTSQKATLQLLSINRVVKPGKPELQPVPSEPQSWLQYFLEHQSGPILVK